MTRSAKADLWAPWWLYLAIILPLNWARAAAFPTSHLPPPIVVAIAVGQAAIIFAVVTVIWRINRRATTNDE